ncbi:hypothetical protein GCM10027168_41480 [Streptomyces capparidis]
MLSAAPGSRAGHGKTALLVRVLQRFVLRSSAVPPEAVDDLRRVVAVVTLDTPAVNTLATALVLRAPLVDAARQAYRHITAARQAAGVTC